MLAWPFRPNLVIHSLPPGAQVPSAFPSRARPSLPPSHPASHPLTHSSTLPPNLHETHSGRCRARASCIHAAEHDALKTGNFFLIFSFFNKIRILFWPISSRPLPPPLHLPLPSSLCLPSLLPDPRSLPSCPLAASCSSSYHSRKRDTASAQSNQHSGSPLLSFATKASNERFLVLLGRDRVAGGWGCSGCLTEPFVTHLGQIC